jgi:hypothetical protein
MGLFDKQMAKYTEQWLSSIKTEEDVKKLEAQGIDLSQYRERIEKQLAAHRMAGAARYGTDEFDPAALENPIDLSRLDPYKAVPRDVNSEFVKDCAGKLPLFGKDKHLSAITAAPIVFTDVVQAHGALWKAGPSGGMMGAVYVFATDEAHRYDVQWAKTISAKISELKHSGTVPADCKRFIDTLRNDRSSFCVKLSESISGGAEAWCATYNIDKEKALLPKTYFPTEGIVPMLLTEAPRDNQTVSFLMIPSKYYA